jgi:hypothetical protein
VVEPRSWDSTRSRGRTWDLLVHISAGTDGVNKRVVLD